MFFQWDVFEFGFNLMKPFGMCKENITSRDNVMRVLFLLSASQVFAYSLIVLYTSTENFTEAVDSFLSTVHAIAKYQWFISCHPLYKNFFRGVYAYWDEMEFDEKVKQYIHFVRRILRRIESIQFTGIASLAVLYGVTPLIYLRRFIFEAGFRVDSTVLRVIILLSQHYCITVAVHALAAYDAIYMSLCCYVLIQLKLLNVIIRNLGPTIPISRFVSCVKHHLFILSLVSRIKAQNSFIFLIQYVLTLTCVCNQLLLFSGGESTINYQSITAIIYLIYMFLQFSVYCIPAERVGSDLLNLSEVIYSSKWYEYLAPQKKEILLIMMATQRNGYFTIGGFIDMNMAAFVAVFKLAFSFHTVINNVLTEQAVGKFE